MSTTSLRISLSEQHKQEVRAQVEEGRYSNPTDYVRHLIRQDILRKRAKRDFSEFIREGFASPSCGQNHKDMLAEIKQSAKQDACSLMLTSNQKSMCSKSLSASLKTM